LISSDIFELEVKVLNKGVKIREILSKTRKAYQGPKSFLALQKRKPAYQVRYIDFPQPATVIIKDSKELFISTKNEANIFGQPHLWTNNPILVQVIQQWYDIMWEKCG
jgi:hypothetical protein